MKRSSKKSSQSIPLVNRLSFKILFTLVILSLILTAITASSFLLLSADHMAKNIQNRNLDIALLSARQIEWYINKVIQDFNTMIKYFSFIEKNMKNDQKIYQKNDELFNQFEGLQIYASNWKLLYSNSIINKNFISHDDQRDMDNPASIHLSTVHLDSDGLPFFKLGFKLENKEDHYFIIFKADFKPIWDLLTSIQKDKMEVSLFSNNRTLLYYRDKQYILNDKLPDTFPSPPETVFAPIQMQLKRGKGVSYSYLQTFVPVNFKDHKWFLSIQQNLEDAYISVQSFFIQALILLLIMTFVIIIASYYITQLFAAPINTLLTATSVVSKGNWSRNIPVRRNDEIGQLTKAFNTMMENLKQRDMALRESETSYRLITENVNDIIFVLNKKKEFLFLNQQTHRITGYNPRNLFGKKISSIIAEEKYHEVTKFIESPVKQNDFPYFESDIIIETPLGHKTFEVRIVKNQTPDNDYFIYGVARDITERKKAENELFKYQETLRKMASEIVYAEEREKRKFALFLNENIGQTLAMCRLKGKLLQREIMPSGKEILNQLDELLTKSIKEARSLTFDMSSPLLYELGLKAEIERLIEELESKYDILVHFHHRINNEELKHEIKILLCRAVKELLQNSLKHAYASQITVSLIQEPKRIELKISDNGKGFNYEKSPLIPSRDEGFGLFNLSEGIKHLGGELIVNTQPQQGTEVIIKIPLN